jgi:hypothetical protein
MAATLSVKEVNGASSGTPTTVTASRFCTDDLVTPGVVSPLVRPAAGSNYSYVKSFYINADTTPAGTINNIKWYTDGTIGWTGVTIQAKTINTYTQATGTPNTTGAQMTGGADASTLTSASPLSVTGTLSNPSTGKISDYVLIQAVVGTTAVAGTLAAETLTWRYDET